MPYLVFDTETSGLPDWKLPADHPSQPRLASYCLLCVDDDLEIEFRSHGFVKPDGWEMSPEASAVNGLTNEKLHSKGVPINIIMRVFQDLVVGRTLVAHNLQFDSKIARGELRRLGRSDRAWLDGICTMRSLTEACAIPHPSRSGFKFPRLGEACEILLQRNLIGAHDALADAKACLWLLRYMTAHGIVPIERAA